MTNAYLTLKRKQQEEVNNFPMIYAFDDKRFKEEMEKRGLTETDTDKLYRVANGVFVLKTDSKALSDMVNRHDKEMQDAIDGDATGEGFVYEMFRYELANHEYGYTREVDSTLDALGYTFEEIEKTKKLTKGLTLAHKALVG